MPTPTFYGNSGPEWTNVPTEPHTVRCTDSAAYRGRDWPVGVSELDCHKQGLPGQTTKPCELRSLLFTTRDNDVSVFCLFHPFLSFPLHALALFHPLPSTSPGWPSVTSTLCPVWPSLSGWPWCLERRRRTSCVASSWGTCPFWWSRPPRTSWVLFSTRELYPWNKQPQGPHNLVFCVTKMLALGDSVRLF